MERKGYYLKPGVRATSPNVLFSIVASPATAPTGHGPNCDWHYWGGADVCVSRYRRGHWSAPIGARCETPDALHGWMERHAERGARNYVVTPDGFSTVAITQLWDRLAAAPVKWQLRGAIVPKGKRSAYPTNTTWVRRCTFGTRVLIMDYARGPLRWVWLSGRQHWDMPEDEIARAIGEPWRDTGEFDSPKGMTFHTSQARAVLWNLAYQNLANWWRQNAKAPFGLTAASMGVGILRTHIKRRTLCTHTLTEAHQLEREACHGGRQSVWYFGDVGNPRAFAKPFRPAPSRSQYGSIEGPIYNVDVRSMYPWLLRERRFPVKLYTHKNRMHSRDLLQWCRSFGAIARVTVETEVPEYPLRTADRVIYPVGRFTTCLTGPELLQIASEGTIAHVHSVCLYDLDSPFRDAAGALIAMREGARKCSNTGWEMMAKMVANALGGKLAQRRGEWVERPDVEAQVPFGEWSQVMRGKKGVTRFRSLGGLVWEYRRDPSGYGPYTAAFAYLTAYGRLHMRGLRDVCPEQSVLQMDTDGMWVGAAALPALRPSWNHADSRAGDLCVRGESEVGRFLDAKHYFTEAGWVLAGFSAPRVLRGGRDVDDVVRHTPLAGPAGSAPRGTSVMRRASALGVSPDGLSVDRQGWAHAKRKKGSA